MDAVPAGISMKFCSQCGSTPVHQLIPLGDIGIRYSCAACGTVHYRNPTIVAGCVATWQDRVLLCRRAIQPALGLWTLPAGYLELGETVEEAARRETLEEAGVHATQLRLCALYNLTTFGEVYLLFRATIDAPPAAPGPESLDVRIFERATIPWQSLAFPMVREALIAWYQGYGTSEHTLQTLDFIWGPEGAVRVRRRARTNLPPDAARA